MRRALLLLPVIAGCSESSSRSGSIDPDRVTVFFPIEQGRVLVRGFAGATDAPWIYARVHPAPPTPPAASDPEGGFTFEVFGESGNLLELAPAGDAGAEVRGPPIFVQIPQPENDFVGRWYCCAETHTCQSGFDGFNRKPCRPYETGLTECEEDADCFHLANEVLPIDVNQIQVTPPDAEGRISISGRVLPQSLVTVQNRRLSGLGIGAPSFTRTTISDLDGTFSFDAPDLRGRGDDELVVQLRDLTNLASPPAQVLVPDAPITSLDVVSVEGHGVVDEQTAHMEIRLALGGADGRGVCPDSDESPSTCFSGGLFHSMITAIDASIDREGGGALRPRIPAITAARPYIVGHQGDVREGARDLILLLDMSGDAAIADPAPPRRFAAALELVRRLRDRDRVGLIAIGGRGRELMLGSKAAVIEALDQLEDETPGGARDLFGAAGRAAAFLSLADGDRPGGVVAVLTGDVTGTLDQALNAAAAARTALGAHRADIVTFAAGANFEAMRRLTGGQNPGLARNLSSIAELELGVVQLAHELIGAFILVYEIDPIVGKQECISLDLSASINGQAIQSSFRGVAAFEGAAGDPAPCKAE